MGTYNNTLQFGSMSNTNFNFGNSAKNQRYIFVSEDDIEFFNDIAYPDGIATVGTDAAKQPVLVGIYSAGGVRLNQPSHGINIYRYSDGSSRVVIQ